MYKEDKERQKLVLDTLEIALRDILVQQAGGASVADAGLCAGGAGLCVPRAAFRGIDADGNAAQGARHARPATSRLHPAFETVLLQISEEYAKWPW